MIPLLTAALMVSAARTLPACRRARVALVARPRGVVHVAVGALTRTGSSLPPGQRPVCGTRSRRLRALTRVAGGVDLDGRRVCVRCCRTLARRTPAVPGLVDPPRNRDEWLQAFGNLTPANLAAAVRTAETVADTYEVSHLTEVLFGDVSRFATHTDRERDVAALRALILETRNRVTAATRTPDEVAQIAAARDARNDAARRIREAHAHERRTERALAHRDRGGYLAPWERALLA